MGEAALVAAVFLLPLCLGGAPGWALLPLVGLSVLAAGALTWGAKRERHLPRWPLLARVYLLGAGLCALQLVPLSPGMLATWSPLAAELRSFTLEPLGLTGLMPLSLDPPATFRELSKHLCYALLVFAAAMASRRERARERLLLAVVGSGVLLAVIGLGHALLHVSSLFGLYVFIAQPPLLTPFGNPNHLAGFLIVASSVALGLGLEAHSPQKRAALWGAYLLTGLGLVLSLSLGGLLAFALGQGAFVLWLWARRRGGKRPRTLAYAGMALLTLVGLGGYLGWEHVHEELSTVDSVEKLRRSKVELWPSFAQAASSYNRFGMGRGAFEQAYQRHQTQAPLFTFTHPENLVLQLWAEWGLVPGGLFLAALLWGLWRLLQAASETWEGAALCGLFALLVQNLFDFSLELAAVPVAFAVVTGALSRARHPSGGPASKGASWGPSWTVGVLGACAVGALVQGRHSVNRALEALEAKRELGADAVRDAALPELVRHPAAASLYATLAQVFSEARPRRLPETLAFVNRALFLRPLDDASHHIAARALLRGGHRRQALLEYKLAYRASTLGRDGLLSEALAVARGADELTRALPEEDAATLAEAVRKLLDLQRAQEALAVAQWALAQLPPDARTVPLLLRAADACQTQGDMAGALVHLALVEQRAPRSAEPFVARARLYSRQGQHTSAVASLEQGVARFPGDVELLFTLSAEQLAVGEPLRARETLERAAAFVSGGPARGRLFALQAETYRTQGAWAKALDAYRTAARLSPKVSSYHFEVAALLEKLGRASEALSALQEGIRQTGQPADARLTEWRKRLEALRSAPGAPNE